MFALLDRESDDTDPLIIITVEKTDIYRLSVPKIVEKKYTIKDNKMRINESLDYR